MEIKITEFVQKYLIGGDATDFACSYNERGDYAGEGSYNHAVETSKDFTVVNETTRPDIEEYIAEIGEWTYEEVCSWSDEELNGLCLQLIASDYKEWECYDNKEDYSGNYIDATETVDGEYYYYFGM